MPYLLDTDWTIAAMAGRPHAVTPLHRLASEGIAVSLITVAELYEGAFGTPNPEAVLSAIRRFISPFHVIGFDESLMVRFAETRSLLRRRGNLIPDFDLLIGVTAVHHGLTVLTLNARHLQRIPDIMLYQIA